MKASYTNKIAVVYVTYDGAVNLTSGVGVLSRDFIRQYPKVSKEINTNNTKIDLHVVAVDLDINSHGYSDHIRKETEKVCNESGGKLHLVENGTSGDWGFGDIDNWRLVSRNVATKLKEISSSYELVITYLVDTPFLGVPYFSNQYWKMKNIKFVLTAHSDVYTHLTTDFSIKRLEWEAAAFQMLNMYDKVYLAETSKYFVNNLRAHYIIPDGKIISMQTGLVVTDERFEQLSDDYIKAYLISRKIPIDKDLIFSVGRAVSYKGFEDLIKSFALLKQRSANPLHLVFIASPYLYKGSSSNIEVLKKLINKYNLQNSCTPIYQLDMRLPRFICQWHKTRIVAQLSSREPFGLVPEEVRLWAQNKGPIIVTSSIGGFLEQIDDGKNGFLVNPSNHQEVANTFHNILNMDINESQIIRSSGVELVKSRFNYTKNVIKSIKELIK